MRLNPNKQTNSFARRALRHGAKQCFAWQKRIWRAVLEGLRPPASSNWMLTSRDDQRVTLSKEKEGVNDDVQACAATSLMRQAIRSCRCHAVFFMLLLLGCLE
jgi:hypothetical protein